MHTHTYTFSPADIHIYCILIHFTRYTFFFYTVVTFNAVISLLFVSKTFICTQVHRRITIREISTTSSSEVSLFRNLCVIAFDTIVYKSLCIPLENVFLCIESDDEQIPLNREISIEHVKETPLTLLEINSDSLCAYIIHENEGLKTVLNSLHTYTYSKSVVSFFSQRLLSHRQSAQVNKVESTTLRENLIINYNIN